VRTKQWALFAKHCFVAAPGMHLPPVDAWILLAGYAGFDPLGFSDYYDIKWLQEAEIKHGRICMLAAVGMVSWL
jgi:hypothetical protein